MLPSYMSGYVLMCPLVNYESPGAEEGGTGQVTPYQKAQM